jgi:hypothetical protein
VQDKGYRIKYDDGDQENVSLSKEDWQVGREGGREWCALYSLLL